MRRDPWFDNAKMGLVTLVVLGHAWVLLPSTTFVGHGYDFLYAWHVPAFVFVTGYLSRSFTYERRRMWQLVRTVAVPYVVFEAAIAAFRILVGNEQLEDLWRDPHWPMWYLAALFFWRLLTPVFTPLWGGVAIAVAVATSLVAGLYAGDTLDVARVLGLLPFFVMGLKATPENLERLRARWVQVCAVGVFVAIWLVTARLDDWAATEWLYYRARYDELDVSDTQAFLTRAGLLVIGTLGAWAFLALVPRVGGWFTRMGAATLVVYLFHGFFVKGADYAGFPDWAEGHYGLSILLTTVAALGLSLLLAWQPVASRLQHLVDPVGYAERRVDHAHELRDAALETDVLAEAVQDAAEAAAVSTAGSTAAPASRG
ncbi:acyltransferase family protein [Nocardioides sp. zg-579]|uniref:Acyltransferase family protein n=1 Tax=Nocardioides marmotae TaxID=2663857 RepID=A0A6I3J1Z2_9ACTN|nr:acyltransferase family protein [Nocardioides marmotae]MCR6031442.1 acyltransferase family protein [Gordonia jinghuaiqii]MTB95081.1 acyltransferase family protein [Nocardioides marmotae]QKE02424.1 acyltransferase family protein [Nocardioides marmotae]